MRWKISEGNNDHGFLNLTAAQTTIFHYCRETEGGDENTEENQSGFDAENFLLGVYQTAEQGVAFLSSLLDLPNKLNSTRPIAKPDATTAEPVTSPESAQRRGPKNLKHPNLL